MVDQRSKIKVVAIDLVDTLVQHGVTTFWSVATNFLANLGYHVDIRSFRQLFRERFLEYTLGNYEGDEEFLAVLGADLGIADGTQRLRYLVDLRLRCSPAYPESYESLIALKRTCRLLLCSNYVGDWARRLITMNQWGGMFEAMVISSDIRARKPGSLFYAEVIRAAGVDLPSEILVIGDDNVNDIYGAESMQLRAVLLDRGNTVQRLDRGIVPQRVAGTVVVSSLFDVVQLLTKE